MATQPQVTEVQKPEVEVDKDTGKFVYSYQPRDSEGQFIGKPYRFLYTDHEDLVKQLTNAKENGDRYIHEVKTGKRQLKGEAAVPVPTYQPAPESTEEAEKKRREDFRKTAEQEFGAPVDQVRADMKRARELEEYLICSTWAQQNEEAGYYICKENAEKVSKYLKDNNYRISAANLDLAFAELKDTLVSKPEEPSPADSTQQQPTKAEEPREVKPSSTGIIPGQFAGTRRPNPTEKQPLTRERFREINKMSRDQWNKLQRVSPKESEAFLAMKFAQPKE
jgi:hypothetical protein